MAKWGVGRIGAVGGVGGEEWGWGGGDSPLHTHSEEVGIVRKLAMGRGTEVDLEVGRGERGVDSRK